MSIPKKVFVSYKFSDVVEGRENSFNFRDELIDILGDNGKTYKGEDGDSNDMSDYNDDQVVAKIAPYVKNSSITVVLITPNAKNSKWIPWEISMSLRQRTYKNEQNMTRNGIVGVYLPLDYWKRPVESGGTYGFYKKQKECGVITHSTNEYPKIIADNTFNLKDGSFTCENGCCTNAYSSDEGSYIELVEWDEFIKDTEKYFERAWKRRENFEKYEYRIQLENGK